jgi:hypothetical protein
MGRITVLQREGNKVAINFLFRLLAALLSEWRGVATGGSVSLPLFSRNHVTASVSV